MRYGYGGSCWLTNRLLGGIACRARIEGAGLLGMLLGREPVRPASVGGPTWSSLRCLSPLLIASPGNAKELVEIE